MNATREQIFSALFAQAQMLQSSNPTADTPFVTCSRDFRMYSDVPQNARPALYQRQGNQNVQEIHKGMPQYKLRAWWFIYATAAHDSASVPAQQLNALLDAAINMLTVPPGYLHTLSGIVSHAYVDGDVFSYDGNLPSDTDLIGIVPISIITGL